MDRLVCGGAKFEERRQGQKCHCQENASSEAGIRTTTDSRPVVRQACSKGNRPRSRSDHKNRKRPSLRIRLRSTGIGQYSEGGRSMAARHTEYGRPSKNGKETVMSFDVAAALRKSTGRGKSDVANKLVSMFLHEVSRKVCVAGSMSVSDPRYTASVLNAFGQNCLYCGRALEPDRATVEHLNGMNRSSVGLHVPGNVAMACKRCNNEKRRDDQYLLLAENGWESFLSHDGTRCPLNCKTCGYWIQIWPDLETRQNSLTATRERVRKFQESYREFVHLSVNAKGALRQKIETLYRDCQRFATDEIRKLTTDIGPLSDERLCDHDAGQRRHIEHGQQLQ